MNVMEPQNRMKLTMTSLSTINVNPDFFKAFGVSLDPNSNVVGISKANAPRMRFQRGVTFADEKV